MMIPKYREFLTDISVNDYFMIGGSLRNAKALFRDVALQCPNLRRLELQGLRLDAQLSHNTICGHEDDMIELLANIKRLEVLVLVNFTSKIYENIVKVVDCKVERFNASGDGLAVRVSV
jgi:hypothetical protein